MEHSRFQESCFFYFGSVINLAPSRIDQFARRDVYIVVVVIFLPNQSCFKEKIGQKNRYVFYHGETRVTDNKSAWLYQVYGIPDP
jgi:hypothetical protein